MRQLRELVEFSAQHRSPSAALMVVGDFNVCANDPNERIDYLWLGQPLDGSFNAEAHDPKRWAFSGRPVTGGPAGSLSDHLALSVALRFQ